MSKGCAEKGKTRWYYTGNSVGYLNHVGWYNFVAGGIAGSGLSAGTTVPVNFAPPLSRRYWLRDNAQFNQNLLDACYPTIELQWLAEIELEPGSVFRVSDKSFYVQDKDGNNRYYDARAEQAPKINVTVGEWLQPQYEISNLTLTLNNRDGYFNPYLPHGDKYKMWTNAKITIKVGFGEKYENYLTLFEGYPTEKKGLSSTRDSVTIEAYDKLDLSQIPIPPNVFSSDSFPDIDTDSEGGAIPLVYGDWTEEVVDWGNLVAVCINANDELTDQFIFKISDIALESIDEIWLHRGKRKEGEPDGPVRIDINEVVLQEEQGRFIIPKFVEVLENEITVGEAMSAGPGSGLNFITAPDANTNFIQKKIQTNDRVLKRATGEYAIVSIVNNTQLTTTGGVTFNDDDEIIVLTRQYTFIEGDKVTVKAKGKNLNLLSVNRLSDISEDIVTPTGISIDFDGTYWVSDDATQKIYHVTFDRDIIKEIAYADIDPAITSISSIDVTNDQKLWFTDPVQSKVYRYNLDTNDVGLSILTGDITGIAGNLDSVQGISVKANNNFWIVDKTTGDFYEINPFAAVNPFVVTTYNKSVFDATATEILDLSYDEVNDELIVVDRFNNKWYRLTAATGAAIASYSLSLLGSNVDFVTGCSVAQDGTIFFVDQGSLSIYNYTELVDASTNPAIVARDLLQKFGGYNFDDFDLSWNDTARQLQDYKCRAAIVSKEKLVTYVSKLLQQYNCAFYQRFGRFALFWIEFNNFRTDGKLVTEKDIKLETFNPTKEMNQYFNSASASYGFSPSAGASKTSDTYVSPAGISFAGKEVTRKLDLPNIYRREDLDKIIPLMVRLSVPEPEFVNVTYGFRLIRSQIHDFQMVLFDGDTNCVTGIKSGGRRYNNIPCMVRKISYDLKEMSVSMKLWSLGNTAFAGFTPVGRTVGGYLDPIVLSNVGRPARISPIGTILSAGANTLQIEDVNGQDAETRASLTTSFAWQHAYKVSIVDGATKEILETLTVDSVTGDTITFLETIQTVIVPTVKNAAGFITGGHYLEHAAYNDLIIEQRGYYGSYTRPLTNYPITRTQEIEEQRAGQHSFDDGGAPYILYPVGFFQY
jgi:hypothetical protein